uniref:ATP synthase F0 subunit 8 n=1 Tax=Latona dysoni TaxID=3246695 RepID=UPI0021157632|nr:ATP synthase F0 subunit 8 [Donax dysoni]UTM92205.1 ATP synthase F0 subunit 8 [Donax dysoni]
MAMPQMAPLYWIVGLVLVWFVLILVGSSIWWCLGGNNYSFSYKSWGLQESYGGF